MNKELALQMRTDLRLIIEGYESFLFREVTSGKQRVQAVEALATRDIIRSVGMSEVSKNRVDTVLGKTSASGETRDSQADSVLGVKQDALFAEGGRIASAAQPAVETEGNRSNDSLFRNLEECIPCNHSWSWGDFDWERLKEILNFDLERRFKWLLDIEKMFDGNPVLDRLCALLHSFKNLCPQDIAVLIAIMIAYLTKTLDSIKFNFEGVLKDILAMLLRPYIGGLEDFLNAYIQFLVDQVDCILNLIQVSAEEIRDLNISIDIGRKSELTAEEVRTGQTSAFKYNKDIVTGRGDEFFDDVASTTKRTREFLRHDTKRYVHFLTDDIPTYINDIVADVLDWVEAQVLRAQDAVIDILGGEWLVTSQNMSWMEQMRAVATLVNLFQVILELGIKRGELCKEDNATKVISGLNDRMPDQILITDFNIDPYSARPTTLTPSGGSTQTTTQEVTPPAEGSSAVKVPFSLSSCLKKKSDISEAQLRQWIQELS